ncbi:dTDP-4-dehydrorhamnose 3,5-epimerase family protein [Patescibacteria group bacterium]|nr:dTDP-4-dehydrorhamnose 3,5-epimerase family protein [Patescibacteria group bacterium]
MKVEKTSLEGVLLIKPELTTTDGGELFEDLRGSFLETYNKLEYKNHGIDINFVEDDTSISKKNVLRGIHGDSEPWKLVSCVYGKVFFVVVNCDKKSPEFGKWESFDLNDENHWRVLVPPMHGNAYLALTDKVIFQYKQSSYYNPAGKFAYQWDEPKFGIKWPIENPILSLRDADTKYIDTE